MERLGVPEGVAADAREGGAAGDPAGAVKFLEALGPVGALRAAGPRGGDLICGVEASECAAARGVSRAAGGSGERPVGDTGRERPRIEPGRGDDLPDAERDVMADEMLDSRGGVGRRYEPYLSSRRSALRDRGRYGLEPGGGERGLIGGLRARCPRSLSYGERDRLLMLKVSKIIDLAPKPRLKTMNVK